MTKLNTIFVTVVFCIASASAEKAISEGADISGVSVTINRTTKPIKPKRVSANVNIITAKKIKERGYRSVAEILNLEAGITIFSTGGDGQPVSIFVRGMTSSDVLVMIDGEPMVDYTQSSFIPLDIESINVDDIEKIEVIKGGQSSIWGTNAVAGVINIITRKARKDYASVYLGYGSQDTREGGFTLSDKGNHGSFYMSHKIYQTDGISALAPVSAEADGYKYEDTHFKVELKDDMGSTFGAFMHRYIGDFEYDSGFPADPNDILGKGHSEIHNMGLTYNYDNSGRFAFVAKASISDNKRHLDGVFGPLDTSGQRRSVSAIATYRFGEQDRFSLGAERSSITGNIGIDISSNSFSNDAIFANYTYTMDDLLKAQTTFNVSLRYDNFDKFANKGIYRLGIKRNYNAIDGLHTAANIYSAYKAPGLYHISNAIGVLRPEYTTGYDIGIGYKKILNVTYFKNKTTDKIVNPNKAYPPQFTNDPAEQSVDGIELSSELDIEDTELHVGANFTHFFQDNLQHQSQNNGNLFVDYRFSKYTNLNISLHYEGPKNEFDYNTFPPKPITLPSYKTIDATISTKMTDHINLSLSIKNILGEKYQTAKGYNTKGRSIYARIRYTF